MTRDALILAAGRGTRLGPENEGRPKCLALVAGRTILDWQLHALASEGISRVLVVTGFEAEQIEAHVERTGWKGQLHVTFVHNARYAATNVLASWACAAPLLRGDYVYLHGDTVFEPRFLSRLLADSHDGNPLLAVDTHPCADEEMKVVADGLRVQLVSKQLDPTKVTGEFTGIMLVPMHAHAELVIAASQLLETSDADRLFVEAALQRCIDSGALTPRMVDISGLKWREIDFPDDLAAARRELSASS